MGRVNGGFGFEQPRLFPPPLRELTPETSLGFAAIEFASALGVNLIPWQKWSLVHGLELDPSGTDFRFKIVIIEVARQNGKTVDMTVLGLWRLFVYGASEIVSAAQRLQVAEDTLRDAFKLASNHPVLREFLPDDPRPKNSEFNGAWMRETNGSKQIELCRAPVPEKLDVFATLPTWSVTAADRRGGRSMSADLAMIDELRELLSWDAWDAITPTVSARPESQVWCFSNAGDKRSVVLKSLRDKAIERLEMGDTASMTTAFFSWSAPPDAELTDEAALLQANPACGYSAMTLDGLLEEARSTANPDGFKTERMCIWVENLEPGKIPVDVWRGLADEESRRAPDSEVAVGVDVSTDGRYAYVAVASKREDGLTHIEVVAQRAGWEWVYAWLRERLGSSWFDGRVAMQAKGSPSASLAELVDASEDVTLVPWQGADMSTSTLGFFTALCGGMVRHRSQPVLNLAAEGAKDKKAGDVFIWNRADSVGDVSPLVACNVAWWLLHNKPPEIESAYTSGYAEFDNETKYGAVDDDEDLLIV